MRAGVAVSPDGIHWTRCQGPAENFGAFFVGSPPLDLYPITPHIFLERYNASALNPPPPTGLPQGTPTTLNCSQIQSSAQNQPIQDLRVFYHSVLLPPGGGYPEIVELGASGGSFFSFNKTGRVPGIEKGPAGAFDSIGVALARVIKLPDGEFLMFYDGGGAGEVDSIGLAHSSDGKNWTKVGICVTVRRTLLSDMHMMASVPLYVLQSIGGWQLH